MHSAFFLCLHVRDPEANHSRDPHMFVPLHRIHHSHQLQHLQEICPAETPLLPGHRLLETTTGNHRLFCRTAVHLQSNGQVAPSSLHRGFLVQVHIQALCISFLRISGLKGCLLGGRTASDKSCMSSPCKLILQTYFLTTHLRYDPNLRQGIHLLF